METDKEQNYELIPKCDMRKNFYRKTNEQKTIMSESDFISKLESDYDFAIEVIDLIDDALRDLNYADKVYFLSNCIQIYEFDENYSEDDVKLIKQLSKFKNQLIYEIMTFDDSQANHNCNRFKNISYSDFFKIYFLKSSRGKK